MHISDIEIVEQLQELAFQDWPMGSYLVRTDGQFLVASRSVRILLGLNEDGPLNGENIANYYANRDYRKELLERAVEEYRKGTYLSGVLIHFKTRHGDVFAENFCKPLHNAESGEIIGYYGCLIDRTVEQTSKKREEALKDRVTELTIDIGRVLHANNTTLMMVKRALEPTINLLKEQLALEYDRVDALPELKNVLMAQVSDNLAKMLQRLLESGDVAQREKALHPLRWEYLTQLIEDLQTYAERYDIVEAHPGLLRKWAQEIFEIASQIKPGYLARGPVREVQRAALSLQRLTTLIPVQNTQTAAIQMEHSIQALREFVTADARSEDPDELIEVKDVLEKAVQNLSEFARTQNVEIRTRLHCRRARVVGVEREILRTFSNILHNAIKYSWHKTHKKPAWVAIDVACEAGKVLIFFENWGVPIAKDEIDQNLVYQLGYRGRLSSDRNRLGTGIGLTDSLRVVRQHGGSIEIESRPADSSIVDDTASDYYAHPFITTVTIRLPHA